MRRLSLWVVAAVACGWAAFAGAEPTAPERSVPPAVARLLAKARTHLNAGTDVSRVVALHVVGTRTRSLDTRPAVDPFEFKLLLPSSLQWRSNPVLHTMTGGVFWQEPRFEERIRKIAARQLEGDRMRVCLTYLARVPPGAAISVEDLGIRDYEWVKGRSIGVRNLVERLRLELVLDEETAEPLATVTHGIVYNADGSSVQNDIVAVFQDYRTVSGVRFPHRIEERNKLDHAVIALTKIAINTLTPEDFADNPTSAGR